MSKYNPNLELDADAQALLTEREKEAVARLLEGIRRRGRRARCEHSDLARQAAKAEADKICLALSAAIHDARFAKQHNVTIDVQPKLTAEQAQQRDRERAHDAKTLKQREEDENRRRAEFSARQAEEWRKVKYGGWGHRSFRYGENPYAKQYVVYPDFWNREH